MNRKKKILNKLLKRDKRAKIKKNGGAKSKYISKSHQNKLAKSTPQAVIDYWFSDKVKASWFSKTTELDDEIRTKYEFLLESALKGYIDNWQETAQGSLALAIIFDQLPRKMFRDKSRSYQTENNAVNVVKYAIQQGYLAELTSEQQPFIIIPLMHSENLENQNLSIELFKQYKLTQHLVLAEKNQKIIQSYGRFPHRNHILDRSSTVKEQIYLKSEQTFKD